MGPIAAVLLFICIGFIIAALAAWFWGNNVDVTGVCICLAIVAAVAALIAGLVHGSNMQQEQKNKDSISTNLHRQGLNVISVTTTDGNWYATASLTKDPACNGQVRVIIATNVDGDLTSLTIVSEPACMATNTSQPQG